MRKGIVTILTVLFALMLCASSVLGQTSKPSGPGTAPIRIGGAISLTGPWAEMTTVFVNEGNDEIS